MSPKSISETHKRNQQGSRTCLGLFGLVFAGFGVAFLLFAYVIPQLKSREAQDWPKAECKILAAKWKVHHGEDSDTYSIDFRYEFEVDNQRHEGTRFSFANSSGPKSEASRQRKLYPAGTKRTCYYDASDPSNCVLDRDNSNIQGYSLIWILPTVFALIGLSVSLASFFGWGFKKGDSISGNASVPGSIPSSLHTGAASASMNLAADATDQNWSEPRKLKPQNSRLGTLIFLIIFGSIWNGVLSLFFFNGELFQNFDWSNWLFGLFLVPFVLVGIGVALATIHSFIGLFNPTVEIAFSSAAVQLGSNVDIAWEVQGKAERISKLSLEIQGRQSATYRRGTDTVTDVETFEIIPLATVTDFNEMAFGNRSIEIPIDTMHTFEASHNSIKWFVVVHGDIPWSPDINENYEFRVTPKSQTIS